MFPTNCLISGSKAPQLDALQIQGVRVLELKGCVRKQQEIPKQLSGPTAGVCKMYSERYFVLLKNQVLYL